MSNTKRILIRIALFLLIHGIVILLCIVLSNLLHVAASDLFENEGSALSVGTVLSLVAFLAILYYAVKMITVQKKILRQSTVFQFALWEIAPVAVYLLICLIVSYTAGPPQIFIGASGYLFCPYLAFGLWDFSPVLAFFAYLIVYSAVVVITTVVIKKRLPDQTEKEPESAGNPSSTGSVDR
ncbi:MAG: hypothetical protein II797_01025 [Clostridia bacterium]|nr:hypothetical protein [Clostridia bacterium]